MKIFIPELNCFGEEQEIKIKCNNWPLFFHLCPVESLNLMMKSCLEDENYEMCELIKSELEKRK